MKKSIIKLFTLFIAISLFVACNDGGGKAGETASKEEPVAEEGSHIAKADSGKVFLSDLKYNSLGIEIDTLPTRPISDLVSASGQLEVPPQYEATVTAVIGANITSIKVIEGDEVKKGQVLAYLSHPNLTRLQTDYIQAFNRLQFLEKEFERQQTLNEKGVGSGRQFQQARADFQVVKAEVKGLESQLRGLNLGIANIREGNLVENIPIVSPIEGAVEDINVQVGQYVDPQTELFEVINTEHVHADLLVFAKDVYKIEVGQKVLLQMESIPGKTYTAKIYSIGKKFEQDPKAVHVHAEIQEDTQNLVPGMYINGKIVTGSEAEVTALPEGAVVEEEGKSLIFIAEKREKNGETEWFFEPLEVKTGETNDGWVEIKLLEPLPEGAKVAWNNAYYLIAEMKKSQTSHGH